MSEGGEPSAPATPGLIPLSYTTPWDAALKRTQIELTGNEICSLLEIKRLPQTWQLASGQVGFQRMGLEFERINRNGQRTAWLIKKPENP